MTVSSHIVLLLCFLATACDATSFAKDNPPPSAGRPEASKTKEQSPAVDSETTKIVRGIVVDEKGVPAANINVTTSLPGDAHPGPTVVTDPAGKFEFVVPDWRTYFVFGAADRGGDRLGFLEYDSDKTGWSFHVASGLEPRIVLRATRPIAVTVVDGKEQPVATAKIGMGFQRDPRKWGLYQFVGRFTSQLTDAAGKAVVHVPSDLPLACVFAVKAGTGFDYACYGPKDEPQFRRGNRARPGGGVTKAPVEQGQKQDPPPKSNDPARRAADDRRPVKLVLGGVHIMRMHLVDERRRPLKGVPVLVSYIQRLHRRGPAVFSYIEEFRRTTDAAGIAQFEAIPVETSPILVFGTPSKSHFFREQPIFDLAEHTTDFRVIATTTPVVHVQVTDVDGRPAVGAQISYTSRALLGSRTYAGSIGFPLQISPEGFELPPLMTDAYFVMSATKGQFASTMAARVARLGGPARPVKLVLRPAARVHGTLTIGKDRRGIANQPITLIQRDDDNYSKLPEDEQLSRIHHLASDIPFFATTDERGRFEFYAAPGPYVIGVGRVVLFQLANAERVEDVFRDRPEAFEIKDQKQIQIDLHCDKPWSPGDGPKPKLAPVRLRAPGQ